MMVNRKNTLASKLLMAVLSVALVFTMMPLSAGFAFAADAKDYQPALTITGPDGTVTTYQTVEDVVAAFTDGEDKTLVEGVTLKGIYVKKLLSGYPEDAVVTVQTQDNYTGTLNASGKTVAELKAMKGILAYQEGETPYDPTSDELDGKGNKKYKGYFVFYVGKDGETVLKDKWVNRITITAAGEGGEDPNPPATVNVLTVTGDVVTPQQFVDIKTLKGWARDNNLVKTTTFNTTNSADTDEAFKVEGVTIESLINAAVLKDGMELDSVKVTADASTKPYEKTFTADQILNTDLDGNQAMFIWSEKKVDSETADKVQKIAIGKFKPEDKNRGMWVKSDVSIDIAITAKKIEPTPAPQPVVKAPGRVTISKATPGKKQVKLTWKKVKGAKGYTVYKATKKNGKYKAVKTTTSLKYTVKKLKKGKTYYFKVRAYKMNKGKKLYGKYSKIKKAKAK